MNIPPVGAHIKLAAISNILERMLCIALSILLPLLEKAAMNATGIPQCCDAVSSFSNNLHALAEGGTAVMANAGKQRRCSAMVGYFRHWVFMYSWRPRIILLLVSIRSLRLQ